MSKEKKKKKRGVAAGWSRVCRRNAHRTSIIPPCCPSAMSVPSAKHDIHFSLDLWSLPRMVARALLQFPIKPSDLGPCKLLRDGPSSPPPPQFHPDPVIPHHFRPHPPGSSS